MPGMRGGVREESETVTNRSYRSGYRFERRVRAVLEREGYVVIRAAGSKGPADLVALRRGHPPVLVQCKRGGRIGKDERRALSETTERAGGVAVLAKSAGKRVVLERIGREPRRG